MTVNSIDAVFVEFKLDSIGATCIAINDIKSECIDFRNVITCHFYTYNKFTAKIKLRDLQFECAKTTTISHSLCRVAKLHSHRL